MRSTATTSKSRTSVAKKEDNMSNIIKPTEMCCPELKDAFQSDEIMRDSSSVSVLDVRRRVAETLSKMKSKDVNVFDECIAFCNEELTDPKHFEISFALKENATSKSLQIVHLTGLVSEVLTKVDSAYETKSTYDEPKVDSADESHPTTG